MQKNKILIIGDYPPPYGGISIHVASLADRMKKAGINSEVLDIGINRSIKREDCLQAKGYFDFTVKIIIHLKNKYMIHLHTNGHNPKSWILTFITSLCAIVMRSPVVVTFHSGLLPSYLKEAPPFYKLMAYSSIKMITEIICVSEEICNAIKIISNRVNGVHIIPAFFNNIESELVYSERADNFIGKHSPVISTVTHFSPEYGIHVLLKSVTGLVKNYSRLGLIIIGEGDKSIVIENEIRKLSLQDNVMIMKSMKHGECLYAIKNSNLFVRPSFIDGDSIAVREAILLGTPVIASNAVRRPDEATLFQTGDPADLENKISMCLKGRGGIRVNKSKNSEDNFNKISAIYKYHVNNA